MIQTRIFSSRCTMKLVVEQKYSEKLLHSVLLVTKCKLKMEALTRSGERILILITGTRRMNKPVIKDH